MSPARLSDRERVVLDALQHHRIIDGLPALARSIITELHLGGHLAETPPAERATYDVVGGIATEARP